MPHGPSYFKYRLWFDRILFHVATKLVLTGAKLPKPNGLNNDVQRLAPE
jgi:hypothetical protein